jgi:hypothetical protein
VLITSSELVGGSYSELIPFMLEIFLLKVLLYNLFGSRFIHVTSEVFSIQSFSYTSPIFLSYLKKIIITNNYNLLYNHFLLKIVLLNILLFSNLLLALLLILGYYTLFKELKKIGTYHV